MNIKEYLYSSLSITEAYQMPPRLLEVMLDSVKRVEFLNGIQPFLIDSNKDPLRDIFREEHRDRDKFKQDFTPDSVAEIATVDIKDGAVVADICAGTGALSFHILKRCPNSFIHCEELSERALPFLLMNFCLRNCTGEVVHGDSLKRETKGAYRLTKGEKFSTISKMEHVEQRQFDYVVMNPPYSIKWKPKEDERFKDFGLAPKQYADYAFILHGLNMLNDTGTLTAIIPHGMLFRANKEGIIRTNLCKANLLDVVLGLPNKLFMNTQIPVAIVKFRKGRSANEPILFIDASKEFEKGSNRNYMRETHVNKVVSVLKEKKTVERFSSLVTAQAIEENEFNLNIPRYVDTFEPEEPIDLAKTISELLDIQQQINDSELEFSGMLMDLTGYSVEEALQVAKWRETILKRQGSKKSLRLKEPTTKRNIQKELF